MTICTFSSMYPVKQKNIILFHERTFWAPYSAPDPGCYPLEACLSNSFFDCAVINAPFLLKLAQVDSIFCNQNNSN